MKQSINWKVFIMTSVAMFIIVMLQHLGIQPLQLISPLPARADIFNSVVPKLEKTSNQFRLKKPLSFIHSSYAASSYDAASAYAVLDFDSGEILSEKNSGKKLPIASLTKIMSAVVALDLANSNELMTVSKDAPHTTPTRLDLTPGEQLTVEELLNAALLTSANDCVRVLQEGIDAKYGQAVFVRAMNAKAAFLGLTHTHFMNPQGFDDQEQYSDVEDLAILTHYALSNYPLIRKIVAKDHEVLAANQYHKEFYLNNWQGLIGVYPGAEGVKIGNTDMAGTTTIVLSERESKKVLAVLLGAPDIIARDLWTAELLDYGFEKESGLPPAQITQWDLRQKYATWKYFN